MPLTEAALVMWVVTTAQSRSRAISMTRLDCSMRCGFSSDDIKPWPPKSPHSAEKTSPLERT